MMERKPQQQTLSIRISDSLREFLERAKQVLSNGRGEPVSASDVAKIMLEAAREERLDFRIEVGRLQERTTESMWAIRKKWELNQALSRAEWVFLGMYIQIACEEVTDAIGAPSAEALIAVLESLLAVRALRKEGDPSLDLYYLDNVGVAAAVPIEDVERYPELIPQAVGNLIQQVRAGTVAKPTFAGRILFATLRDEDVTDIVAFNQALNPHLGTLFRLGARGHWIREHRPVRARTRDESVSAYVPPVQAEGFQLNFLIDSSGELKILINMQAKDVAYPLTSYPEIREFAEMLRRLEPGGLWNGSLFFGHGVAPTADRPGWQRFWRRRDEIAFAFSVEEWNSLRSVFATALELPQLQPILAELTLVYGEI